MNTLIYTALLGFLCLVAEVLNLRKILVPLVVVGLLAIFGVNTCNWDLFKPYFNNMVYIDNFAVGFSGLIIGLSALILLLSHVYYKNHGEHLSDYLSIIVFTITGAVVMVSYANMAMLFLGIEMLSISLYIMAGSNRNDSRSNEAGFKYFLMGSFISGFLLFGIALIYGATGSFHLQGIADYLQQNAGNISPMFYAGMLMMLVAMLFKVSAAPFHFWAPDVYEGSPALVTSFMSTIVKIAAFGAFYRLYANAFLSQVDYTYQILWFATIATLFIGNLSALSQVNFKRLLAYSGISHAGFLLLAILCLQQDTAPAILYYGLAYGVATIGAFAIAIPVFAAHRSEKIEVFNGLAKKQPLVAAALTVFMLSLAGIPPLAGFFAKYYILTKTVSNGEVVLAVIAIINSIIGIFYYFKVILAMYTQEGNETKVSYHWTYAAVIIFTILLTITTGLFPSTFILTLTR